MKVPLKSGPVYGLLLAGIAISLKTMAPSYVPSRPFFHLSVPFAYCSSLTGIEVSPTSCTSSEPKMASVGPAVGAPLGWPPTSWAFPPS